MNFAPLAVAEFQRLGDDGRAARANLLRAYIDSELDARAKTARHEAVRATLREYAATRPRCNAHKCGRFAAGDETWCHLHQPDEVAIERALRGEPVTLTRDERIIVIRTLHERGMGDGEIRGHIRCSDNAVKYALRGAA